MNLPDQRSHTTNLSLTHAVDIFAFVEARDIPFVSFETPYYLSPEPGGEKVYTLLREALTRTKKVAIAYVLIKARRHLAAVAPCGPALLLTTLHTPEKAHVEKRLQLTSDKLQEASVQDEELAEVALLIERMTKKWDFEQYAVDKSGEPTSSAAYAQMALSSDEQADATGADYLNELSALYESEDPRLPLKSVLRRGHLVSRPHRESWPRTRSRRMVN